MHSSTSNSEYQRPIPARPWNSLLLLTLALAAIGLIAWELRARAWGYAPGLNDTSDLWADQREAVKPDSIVLLGDSRPLFDLDLNALEQGLGKRPIQLSLAGTCAYPILDELSRDESFHGTVILGLIPAIWFAPPAAPPYQNCVKALKRYQTRNLSQRAGHHLGMFLEEKLAFMKQEDLVLPELVRKIPVPNRANSYLPPKLPPYFQTIDRERRTRMADQCVRPGPLQDRVKTGWIPLFTPPKFPDYTPKEVLEGIGKSVEARFGDTVAAVNRIRARGGRVVFVRFPVSGELKELEEKLTPRAGPWTRLMKETGAPNIYYSDHPELIFDCPEWSHLSGPDSEEFTKRLVPHLKRALTASPDSRG